MSKWLKALSISAVALLVALALGVGTQSAFARSVVLTCPNDGNVHLGSCIDNPDCKQKCVQAHPEIPPSEIQGRCISGCCTCLF
jgi:hypothetical protein